MSQDKELDELLQKTGDAVADVFDQMLKGNWKDDHGHDVTNNRAMRSLQPVMLDIMRYRSKYLGYREVVDVPS